MIDGIEVNHSSIGIGLFAERHQYEAKGVAHVRVSFKICVMHRKSTGSRGGRKLRQSNIGVPACVPQYQATLGEL
jgi:hypothetical protein